jgi:hypothetical protein
VAATTLSELFQERVRLTPEREAYRHVVDNPENLAVCAEFCQGYTLGVGARVATGEELSELRDSAGGVSFNGAMDRGERPHYAYFET